MARQSSLLIIGCGDVGLRIVRALGGRLRVFALTSSPARCDALRAAGVRPLVGDLDDPATLGRLAGLADAVLYLAPPPTTGHTDPRLRALLGEPLRASGLAGIALIMIGLAAVVRSER